MDAPAEPLALDPIRLAAGPAARARRRLARLGPDGCTDAELLGICLGAGDAAQARGAAILDRLGGPVALARAEPTELIRAGAAPEAARRLSAAMTLARRASTAMPEVAWRIGAPSDAAEPLMRAMGGLEREELRVLLLDTKNAVTAERTVYVGNLAGSSVRVGEVFRDAVRHCAAAIIVVHNHPSGDPSPSGEDLRITAELAEAGRLLDVELLDHLIVGRSRWTSLRALGLLAQPSTTMR